MKREPPIQNLSAIDIVGRRHDGGVDLVIVGSGPLDDGAETLRLLERKIRNYITEVGSPQFQREFGTPSPTTTSIIVSCEHPVSEAAHKLIESLAPVAAQNGARLSFRENMSVH